MGQHETEYCIFESEGRVGIPHMSDIDQKIEQFVKVYNEAPADRPFDEAIVRHALADLAKCGVEDGEVKSLLRAATTSDHDLIRQDSQESAGDALNAKELSLLSVLS
jgi:hypothetical protein